MNRSQNLMTFQAFAWSSPWKTFNCQSIFATTLPITTVFRSSLTFPDTFPKVPCKLTGKGRLANSCHWYIMIDWLEIVPHDQGWNCFFELNRKFAVCPCLAFLAITVTRTSWKGHTKFVNSFVIHAGVIELLSDWLELLLYDIPVMWRITHKHQCMIDSKSH